MIENASTHRQAALNNILNYLHFSERLIGNIPKDITIRPNLAILYPEKSHPDALSAYEHFAQTLNQKLPGVVEIHELPDKQVHYSLHINVIPDVHTHKALMQTLQKYQTTSHSRA